MARRAPNPSSLAPMMRDQGDIKVRPLGMRGVWGEDLYHRLMQLTWPRLGLLFAAGFLAFNLLFGVLYRLDPAGLSEPHEPSALPLLARDFFFSVHTVATIGYGNTYPVSAYANVLVVAEITVGILIFALTTGIAFARFSRPTARILFSEIAVVREVGGTPTLMLRAANQRHNLIYSAQVEVSLLIDDMFDGKPMRRFVDLELLRHRNPVFALTWTIMHPIDANSPLHGWIEHQSQMGNAEIIVVLSGTDASSGQTIYGRWAYRAENVRWGMRFADILGIDEQGVRTIDYERFHAVEEG